MGAIEVSGLVIHLFHAVISVTRDYSYRAGYNLELLHLEEVEFHGSFPAEEGD